MRPWDCVNGLDGFAPSHMVTWSHDVLVAPAAHPVFSSRHTAALLVIESLITSLMVSGNNQVAQAEKLTNAISAYLYTDKPGNDSGVDRPAKRIVRG